MDARRSASCWIVSNIPPADTHRKHTAVRRDKPGSHWLLLPASQAKPRGREGGISQLDRPLSMAHCNNAGRDEFLFVGAGGCWEWVGHRCCLFLKLPL